MSQEIMNHPIWEIAERAQKFVEEYFSNRVHNHNVAAIKQVIGDAALAIARKQILEARSHTYGDEEAAYIVARIQDINQCSNITHTEKIEASWGLQAFAQELGVKEKVLGIFNLQSRAY